MDFHEIANLFPMMQPDELSDLVDDIKQNGLIEPIVLYEEKILDGRNRYLACGEAGVKPHYEYYKGNEPRNYVISKNLHRRHLNETQRAVVASKIANMKVGRPTKNNSADLPNITQKQAGKLLNISPRTIRNVGMVEQEAPELMPKLESGEMTVHEAVKEIKKKERIAERNAIANSALSIPDDNKWHVYHGDIRTWRAPRQYDFIITDPPYPKEYLELWSVLAQRAKEWLKPGGLLIAMSGQSYLDKIYNMLSEHLDYYWTASYLTPGQSASIWNKNIIPKWKPLLIYSVGEYKGKMFGDVYRSGENDKSVHKWGQSISGMSDIIAGVCLPGQYILDPFCGAGTTGIAAIEHGCLFDGLEIELDNVNISKGRINDRAKN